MSSGVIGNTSHFDWEERRNPTVGSNPTWTTKIYIIKESA
jgi:hypothetical protein